MLAVDDQTDCNALDSARAEAGLHLLPQHRRQRVAVQPVEDAPALLRPHQVLIYIVRIFDRFENGRLGDLVKDDALDGNLGFEHLHEVPADRLAFPVGVGREEHFTRALEGRLQRLHMPFLVVRDDVVGLEVLVGIDAQPTPLLLPDLVGNLIRRFGQVAHVPVTRLDIVAVGIEEPLNRPRLGRRFHNHQCFCHLLCHPNTFRSRRKKRPPGSRLSSPCSSNSSRRGSSSTTDRPVRAKISSKSLDSPAVNAASRGSSDRLAPVL